MQIKNNYQTEWEVRGKYGIPVEKGVGVFNGDTGILREINTFAETSPWNLMRDALWSMRSSSWMSWSLPMPLPSTNHREVNTCGGDSSFGRPQDADEQKSSLYSRDKGEKVCDIGRR